MVMSTIISRLLIVASLAAPAAAHGPGKAPVTASLLDPAARGAASTVDAFHSALQRGDAAAAAALLAPDVLIFESGEVERSRAEYASHHLAADIEFTKAVPSTVTRRAGKVAGDMAWMASEGRTTGTYHDRPIDQATTETMVLKRVGKAWNIVQIHWSSAKAR